MKILQIHVTGFGKLTDKIYNLSEISSILSENGEGKSTLASFIEGMFYGLEAKNSELRAYKPWTNSPFGGSITFTVGDKTYRVERFWGSRKADDVFSLYSMPEKKPCFDYSEKLGEELFGIDRSGFKRTCFFTSEDYRGGESSIQSRLNSLIADTDEFNSFDKITLNIEKEIKTYENAQHRGKLPDIRREIEELRTQIALLSSSPEEYKQTLSEQEEILNKINNLKKEIKTLEEETEKKILSGAGGSEKALEILNQQEEDIKLELANCNKILNGYNPNQTSLAKLSEEKRKLEAIEKKSNEVYKTLLSQPTTLKPLPDNRQLQEVKNQAQTLNSLEQNSKTSQNQKGVSIGLFLIAISLIIISALNFSRLYICIPFGVCSILFLAVSVYFLFFNKQKDNKQITELKTQLERFLLSYGYGGYDIITAIDLIEKEIILQEEQLAKNKALSLQKATLNTEYEQVKGNIDGFFAKFNLYGSYEENLYTLKSAIEKTENCKSKLSLIQIEKLKYSSSPVNNEINNLKQKRTHLEGLLSEAQHQSQDNKINLVTLTEKISKLEQLTTKRLYLIEQQQNLEKEKYYLEQTLNCLHQAKQNLTSGAYEPIKNSLKKYCELLLPDYKGIRVDNDFKITCEISGVTRDFSSFSQGQKQLINFALRLGLIDALFEKEKPFIIIDDAFSPLDEQNFELCKKLVAQIGKTMQVIYLTPHPSRSL